MTGGFSPYGSPRPPHHPFASLFPMLGDKELDELGDDIKENGQAESCKLQRGMLLDGRNREDAAYRKGLGFRWEAFPGDDRAALAFVISKNLRRRHLTESQRAMVAAKLGKFKLGDNQHSREAAQICAPTIPGMEATEQQPAPMSQTERSELLNVSRRSVQHAEEVAEKGAPELQAAVDAGKIAVSTAADLADLPKDQQVQVASMSEKDILKAAKKIRKEAGDKRRAERVEKIRTIAAGNSDLPTDRKFPVLYMDPPTKFAAGDSDRSTENHYPTMTEQELAKLPIGELATPDAVLFIWSTVPWLRKTMALIEAYGFEYVSEIAWDKATLEA